MEHTAARLAARLAAMVRRMPPRAILGLAAAFWGALLSVVAIGSYGGDMRAFVCLGERITHPAGLAAIPRTSEYGYDGQYYAALALDPFLRRAETVASLDAPFYRASRIGLPLTAWALAYGQPTVTVVFYQLLCWGGCVLAVYLTAVWLAAGRRPAVWALPIAISAGLATSMFRCTPDGAAVALILLALLWHARQRPGAAVVALVAATLVRETSFLAALAVAFVELRQRRWRQAIISVAAPLAALGAWQLYLRLHLAGAQADRGTGAFGVPFAWLPRKLARLAETGLTAGRMEVLGLIALAACFVALALVLGRFPRWSATEASFAGFGLMALALGYPVYVEVYAHARVLLALPCLATLLAAGEQRPAVRRAFAAVPLLLAVTGLLVLRAEFGLGTVRSAAARVLASAPAGGAPGRDDGAAPAPPVEHRPTATPTPTPTPPPPPALFLLPAARLDGHDNARWRTELVLENSSPSPARLRVELLLAGKDNSRPLARQVTLEGAGRLVTEDALGDLFAAAGSGALRVRSDGAPVNARLRTYDAAKKAPRGHFLEGRPESAALVPGRPAVLRNLANEPDARTRKRSNVGMLNVGPVPVDVEITLRGVNGAVLGRKAFALRPWEFRQVNDVFLALGAGKVGGGSATVATTTPGGAVLAYAAVVRRQPAGVTYVTP